MCRNLEYPNSLLNDTLDYSTIPVKPIKTNYDRSMARQIINNHLGSIRTTVIQEPTYQKPRIALLGIMDDIIMILTELNELMVMKEMQEIMLKR